MRKLLLIVLSILTCFCMAIGLTACGKDGQSNAPTIEIGSDGYWYINGTKTDYKASGEKGEQGEKGDKGDSGEQGEQGEKGDSGEKGSDGVNGSDGKDGKDGVDGKTPEIKIGENGNWFIDGVDTNVKAQGEKGDKGDSGEKGSDGVNGSDGKDGKDGVDGVNGSDGKDGVNGKSAYEIYKEKYGYEGTEEQWLDDLVNGRLALKDKYTVTFDSDGGSEVKSQEVSDGKKANEPDAPTKTGYTFGGWFVKTTEWNFLAYTVTENVTLKAKWIANEYTLKFNSNGGNEIADMAVTYYGDYTLPEPTKEHYVFLGWKEGETVYEQSGKWQKTSGATLTAEWVIAKSTITFETNGGSVVAPMTINYGENYTLPTSTRENYALVGWFLGENKFESGTPLTGDITLSARWQGVTDTFEYTEKNGEITLTKFKGGVTDVIIPANINGVAVTKLADGIFRNNTKITSVTFDGTFENYDAKLFQGCFSLRSLVISGVYDKQLYYLFGDSINDIPESFAEITFAENSNYVDGTMFKNEVANHIVTYVIPDGTTEIKDLQFSDYGCMQAVSIPDSVTSIGSHAFYCCYELTRVIIGNSVTSIGIGTFYYCSRLTSVIIGNSVASIGSSAFYGCSGLTSITIPDSVTSISRYAFDGCDNLIRKSKGICYVDKWVIGVVNNLLSKAEIENTTRGIAYRAFDNCSGLKNIYITDLAAWCKISGLDNLMYYVSNEKNLYLNGELVTNLTIPDSVTSIGMSAFYYCGGLTSVTIGNGVTSIGWSAFEGCSGLTSVTIPDSVISIGSSAFYGCSGLTSVTIPDSVTSIGNGAFSGCSGLTSVTIPDSMTSIGSSAFDGCSGLTSVIIGNGVTSIGSSAFSDCSGLKTVFYKGSAEQWKQISIGDSNSLLTGATRYYYSETEPSLNAYGTAYNGNYWHYDSDGKTPLIWKKETIG